MSSSSQGAPVSAVVIGVDFTSYIDALRKYDVSDNDGCIYLVSDIESLSQQVQRAAGNSAYHLPIIAGIGEGGALALAIAAQTPDATIGQTLAIDPVAGIPLTQQLCTPASKKTVGDRMIYGLSDGSLPDPIIAAVQTAASNATRLLLAMPLSFASGRSLAADSPKPLRATDR